MYSLHGPGRPHRFGNLPGFQAASRLLQSNQLSQHLTQNRRLRAQQLWKSKTIHSKHRLNLQRFQIYNSVSKTWAGQINQSPILLTVNDIKNWTTFRVKNLKMHRLYLWHATQFDWIPVWSTKKGCLLMNLDILKFDNVNYHQLKKRIGLNKTQYHLNQFKFYYKDLIYQVKQLKQWFQ